MDIVARVTTGRAWPDRLDEKRAPHGCVILNVEDAADRVTVPRLKAADCDLSMVNIIERKITRDADGNDIRRTIDLRADIGRIGSVIDETPNCKLLVVDPLTALMGDIDGNSNTQVRAVLEPLADLADSMDIAIVVVSHLTKSSGTDAALRTLGSVGFTAAARSVWFVVDDPTYEMQHLFLPVKSNYSRKRRGLTFTMGTTDDEIPFVLWGSAPATMGVDEALATQKSRTERDEVKDWLADFLGDSPKASADVYEKAEQLGFSKPTLKRAKKDLRVVAEKLGMNGGWTWRLPKGLTEEAHTKKRAPSYNSDTLRRDSPNDDPLRRGSVFHVDPLPDHFAGNAKNGDCVKADDDVDDSDRLEREAIMSVELEQELLDLGKRSPGNHNGFTRRILET